MLERKYDPGQPYGVVYYGRMSSSGQNRRSPDQQFATIEETQARCGFPWRCLSRYRDDGVSGPAARTRLPYRRRGAARSRRRARRPTAAPRHRRRAGTTPACAG